MLRRGFEAHDGRALVERLGIEAFAVGPDDGIPLGCDARLRKVGRIDELFDVVVVRMVPCVELADGSVAPIDQDLAVLGKLKADDEGLVAAKAFRSYR